MGSNVDSSVRGAERRAGTGLYPRYLRLLKFSRLLKAAFWTMMAFFLLWAIPWLPGGLSRDDYDGPLAFTLLLGGIAFGTGVAALALKEWLHRIEEALVAFNAVYDNTTGLYNRRYFYDRLALECERAHRQGTPLSLLLFRFEPDAGRRGGAEATLRLLADEAMRETRGSDVVAALGSNELAVAAVGVDKTLATQVGQRLRLAIGTVLAERAGQPGDRPVQVGISEYPVDGTNAEALLRLAREAMRSPDTDQAPRPGVVREEAA